jgi:hypothetical protein
MTGNAEDHPSMQCWGTMAMYNEDIYIAQQRVFTERKRQRGWVQTSARFQRVCEAATEATRMATSAQQRLLTVHRQIRTTVCIGADHTNTEREGIYTLMLFTTQTTWTQ